MSDDTKGPIVHVMVPCPSGFVAELEIDGKIVDSRDSIPKCLGGGGYLQFSVDAHLGTIVEWPKFRNGEIEIKFDKI